MKIAVTKTSDNTFEFSFGDQAISVGLDDLKSLLMEVTRVLVPGGGGLNKGSEAQASDLVSRMKSADDVVIQIFIPSVDEDDILIPQKFGDDDEALLKNSTAICRSTPIKYMLRTWRINSKKVSPPVNWQVRFHACEKLRGKWKKSAA